MNNKLRFSLLVLIVGVVCCGCNGNITRDIRHAGFSMGGIFECSPFYPKDKEDITQIIYEPWHYRYVGKEHAAKIMESGVCLEEYIEELKGE